MLTDGMLDEASKALAEYRRTDSLPQILSSYAYLIDDYKRLKREYEGVTAGLDHSKRLPSAPDSKDCVLVIVDGDQYIFDSDFILDGEEGGSRAAKQLRTAIEASLRRKRTGKYYIIMRVYADFHALSSSLSKKGLCGETERSIASFAVGFNKAFGLSDMVDSSKTDTKEGSNLQSDKAFKIECMIRMYAENPQCKHIYVAACDDSDLACDLGHYKDDSDRFTLLTTPSVQMHEDFKDLGMSMEELPKVFMTAPLSAFPDRQLTINPAATLSIQQRNKRPRSPDAHSESSTRPHRPDIFNRFHNLMEADSKVLLARYSSAVTPAARYTRYPRGNLSLLPYTTEPTMDSYYPSR